MPAWRVLFCVSAASRCGRTAAESYSGYQVVFTVRFDFIRYFKPKLIINIKLRAKAAAGLILVASLGASTAAAGWQTMQRMLSAVRLNLIQCYSNTSPATSRIVGSVSAFVQSQLAGDNVERERKRKETI